MHPKQLLSSFFLLFLLIQASALPQFTREDEEEDGDTSEDVDDTYDEEDDTNSTSSKTPQVEKQELDKDEKEDQAAREKLAERLGIKNFSRAAIAEKASNVVISYISGGFLLPPTPKPKRRVRPRIPATTLPQQQYKISKSSTSSPVIMPYAYNMSQNSVKSFVITVPQGMGGPASAGSTIEINIPMSMGTHGKAGEESGTVEHHLSQMSISSPDDQNVKNIEAAIMEALLLAQQVTGANMSTRASPIKNGTGSIVLDFMEGFATGMDTTTTKAPPLLELYTVNITEATPEAAAPTRKRKVRTTIRPANADDILGVGPVTDIIVSQIRSGQLPAFLFRSIMKLANSRYMQIAVDAVECAVFYYCPDDTELGTLMKGSSF